MAHRMIIRTQSVDSRGRATKEREIVEHIPTSQVEAARQKARESAPRGATRTVRVVQER